MKRWPNSVSELTLVGALSINVPVKAVTQMALMLLSLLVLLLLELLFLPPRTLMPWISLPVVQLIGLRVLRRNGVTNRVYVGIVGTQDIWQGNVQTIKLVALHLLVLPLRPRHALNLPCVETR